MKLLVEGRPGSGKTTMARRLVARLSEKGTPVAGFTTAEIRRAAGRVGFSIDTVDGRSAVLAHVDVDGPRVGRYGVDVAAFEDLALAALEVVDDDTVVVIDELGKMELLSEAFRASVQRLFDGGTRVIATSHVHRDPFTERLEQLPGTELVKLTKHNRDDLPQDIAIRLAS